MEAIRRFPYSSSLLLSSGFFLHTFLDHLLRYVHTPKGSNSRLDCKYAGFVIFFLQVVAERYGHGKGSCMLKGKLDPMVAMLWR